MYSYTKRVVFGRNPEAGRSVLCLAVAESNQRHRQNPTVHHCARPAPNGSQSLRLAGEYSTEHLAAKEPDISPNISPKFWTCQVDNTNPNEY